MKKIYPVALSAFLLCTFFSNRAAAQVSQSFYDHFLSVFREKVSAKEHNFYSSVMAAAQECFNLQKEDYVKEVQLFMSRGAHDTAALRLIPKEVMNRFLNDDYQKQYCTGLEQYKEALELFNSRFCNCITAQYEKVTDYRRTGPNQQLVRTCTENAMAEPDIIVAFQATHAQGLTEAAQACMPAFLYLHCPILKREMESVPSLLSNNDLRRYVSQQRWDASKHMLSFITGNIPATQDDIILDKRTADQFNTQRKKLATGIANYNKGKHMSHVDWGPNTITETFAAMDDRQQFTILFRFIYRFKTVGIHLKIDQVTAYTASQIQDKKTVLQKLENQLNPPNMIAPGRK